MLFAGSDKYNETEWEYLQRLGFESDKSKGLGAYIKPEKKMVRAKFRVESKIDNIIDQSKEGKKITMRPVYDSNPESENGKFFKLTPGGVVELSTVNEEAAAQFEVGDEFFVDFTKA